MRIVFIISLSFWVSNIIFGQSNQLSFQYLGEEQGLIGGQINAINKDDLGFLWVATQEGLFKYDGSKFQIFDGYKDTISKDVLHDVRGLTKDSQGRFWVGSRQGWLTMIDPMKNTLKSYQLPEEDIKTNTIWNISLDKEDQLWIAFERGLAYFNPETETFKTWQSHEFVNAEKSTNYNATYAVTADQYDNNIVWVGTRRGHFYFKKKEETFHPLPLPEDINHIKIFRFAIHYEQDDSLLYLLGHDMSILAFHKEKQTWKCLYEKKSSKGDPRFILKDGAIFWLGTTDLGLGRIDLSTSLPIENYYQNESTQQLSLKKGFVEYIYKDKKGVFWIGVETGICVLAPDLQDFKHYYPDYKDNANNFEQFSGGYFQEKGDSLLYFCSRYNGALHILNRNTGKEKRISHKAVLPNKNMNIIWQITSDRQGQIWMATNRGIYLYDKKEERLINSSWDTAQVLQNQNSQNCITDTKGNVWCIGNFSNVIKIDAEQKQVKVIDCTINSPEGYPKLNGIFRLRIDEKENLWVCNGEWVVRFNLKTKDILRFGIHSKTNPLSSNKIIDFWLSPKGILWVYYKYGGVDKVEFLSLKKQKLTHLGLEDGLASNKIYDIVGDDKGQVWLATGNGLSNQADDQFTNFRISNGLIENNLHKGWHTDIQQISTGEIIFSGRGYFTIFHPDSLIGKEIEPNLSFNQFSVFDQIQYYENHLNSIDKIKLSYTQNYFTVTFTDLNYPYEQAPLYQYRLKGYDTKWRTTSIGKAEYTNVGGGKYELQVRVINENGIAIGAAKSLSIQVSFPFWQTWWFLLLIIATAIAVLLGVYQYRIQQIIEKEQLKTAFNKKIIESEMTALRAQMNPHFMFNSLNSIKSYIIKNEPRIAARYLTKFAKLMRTVLNNSKHETIAIHEELETLKLYVELEQLRFSHQFEFEIELDQAVSSNQIPPLILQPFVENAIWHGLMHKTDATGQLKIQAVKKFNQILISICDNGVGRTKAAAFKSVLLTKHKSMGLEITRNRLEMFSTTTGYSTSLHIEDLLDEDGHAKGTCVHLKIELA